MFFVVFPEDNAEDSGSDTGNVGGGVDSSSEDDCLSDEGEVDVDDPSTWRINRVVSHQYWQKGKYYEYKVTWKGFSDEDTSDQRLETFHDPHLVFNYHHSRGSVPAIVQQACQQFLLGKWKVS